MSLVYHTNFPWHNPLITEHEAETDYDLISVKSSPVSRLMSIVQGLLWARTPPPPSFHVINNFKCSLIFSSPTLRCQFRLLLSMLSLLLVCFWFREKIYYKVHPEMQSQAIIGITTWDELRTVNNLKRLIFLTKKTYFSGLPGAPEDCRVSQETNDSLTVLCSPGWSGGLPQTFHLGMNFVTRRRMKCTCFFSS